MSQQPWFLRRWHHTHLIEPCEPEPLCYPSNVAFLDVDAVVIGDRTMPHGARLSHALHTRVIPVSCLITGNLPSHCDHQTPKLFPNTSKLRATRNHYPRQVSLSDSCFLVHEEANCAGDWMESPPRSSYQAGWQEYWHYALEMKFREGKRLARSNIAGKWSNQDTHPGLLAPFTHTGISVLLCFPENAL